MNKKSFLIRRFVMSDARSVVRLLELVFESRFSSEWWNWKYESNPVGFWGEQGDIWVAENTNELVGHLAVIPEKIKLGSETVTVAQLVDGATHPDYRRLGIFKTLAKNVCSEAQNRYSFLFGFPNELSDKPLISLGWKSFRMVEFLKFLNYDRAVGSSISSNLAVWCGKTALRAFHAVRYVSPNLLRGKITGGPVEIQKADEFSDEINDFWKLVRSEYEVTLERTATFLNWRFSKHFGNYQIYVARSIEKENIAGYLILKTTETSNILNVLHIVDMHALPREDRCMLNLIDKAITIGKNEGFDIIRCRIPRWHKYAKILYKLGFISASRTLQWFKMHQPRLILYPFTEKGKIPRMQEWFYTLADTDWA